MINTYALALKSQSIWEQRYSNSDQHTLTKTYSDSFNWRTNSRGWGKKSQNKPRKCYASNYENAQRVMESYQKDTEANLAPLA